MCNSLQQVQLHEVTQSSEHHFSKPCTLLSVHTLLRCWDDACPEDGGGLEDGSRMPKAKKWCLLDHGGNILALCCGALAEPSRQYKGVNDQTCDVPISGGILD